MGDLDHALSAYENALRHNPMSMSGLQQVAGISRIKENYPKVRALLSISLLDFLTFPTHRFRCDALFIVSESSMNDADVIPF